MKRASKQQSKTGKANAQAKNSKKQAALTKKQTQTNEWSAKSNKLVLSQGETPYKRHQATNENMGLSAFNSKNNENNQKLLNSVNANKSDEKMHLTCSNQKQECFKDTTPLKQQEFSVLSYLLDEAPVNSISQTSQIKKQSQRQSPANNLPLKEQSFFNSFEQFTSPTSSKLQYEDLQESKEIILNEPMTLRSGFEISPHSQANKEDSSKKIFYSGQSGKSSKKSRKSPNSSKNSSPIVSQKSKENSLQKSSKAVGQSNVNTLNKIQGGHANTLNKTSSINDVDGGQPSLFKASDIQAFDLTKALNEFIENEKQEEGQINQCKLSVNETKESSRHSQEESLLDIKQDSPVQQPNVQPLIETKIQQLLGCFQIEGQIMWEVQWNQGACPDKIQLNNQTVEYESTLKQQYLQEFEQMRQIFEKSEQEKL